MNTGSLVRAALLASLSLALTGCMLARQSSPITVLAPQVAVTASPDWPVVGWSLQIDRPRADAMRDSARVLVRPAPSQLQVYRGAAWHEPVPDMLQSVLLQAFEDSGKIAAVSRTGSVRSRFRLMTEIRHFEAVERDGARLDAEIELQIKLVLQRNGLILANHTFVQRQPTAGTEIIGLTQAFERSLSALTGEIIAWTLVQGDLAHARIEQHPGRSEFSRSAEK